MDLRSADANADLKFARGDADDGKALALTMSKKPHSHARYPIVRLIVTFALLAVLPPAALAVSSVRTASNGLKREVQRRVLSSADLSGIAVRGEIVGLGELVDSYAKRPRLVEALEAGDRRRVAFHLRELKQARPEIAATFVARMDGRLVEVFPATSSIVGKDFSFRDWYKGVTRTRQTYVSEAYQSQATGHPLVVAVTTLIRAPSVAKRPGRPLGILVAAYGLSAIQRLADNFAKSQRVTLTVTDQRGTLLASPGSNLAPLASRRADPVVAAALRGASGVTTWKRAGREELVAYNPIEKLGWTVAASIPTRSALAPVAHGKLTPEEFEAMKVHTTVGGKILGRSQSDLLRMSEEIALTHHEWWDGRGYPRGLRGDEIPLYGRIVAVADVFDALTHRRPYKEAWPVERALSEIDGSRGKQFDPQVVEILAALPRDILSEPPEERLAA